jgi:hypothetical protein
MEPSADATAASEANTQASKQAIFHVDIMTAPPRRRHEKKSGADPSEFFAVAPRCFRLSRLRYFEINITCGVQPKPVIQKGKQRT